MGKEVGISNPPTHHSKLLDSIGQTGPLQFCRKDSQAATFPLLFSAVNPMCTFHMSRGTLFFPIFPKPGSALHIYRDTLPIPRGTLFALFTCKSIWGSSPFSQGSRVLSAFGQSWKCAFGNVQVFMTKQRAIGSGELPAVGQQRGKLAVIWWQWLAGSEMSVGKGQSLKVPFCLEKP